MPFANSFNKIGSGHYISRYMAICRPCKGGGLDDHQMVCRICKGAGRVIIQKEIFIKVEPYNY